MKASGKLTAWTSNELPESVSKLAFVRNNPKVFSPRAFGAIRNIVFQDHFPDAKAPIRFTIPEAYCEIRTCLTKDMQTLYIGTPGGFNASYVCSGLFAGLDRVEQIIFENSCFHTDGARSFSRMFSGCKSLKAVSLKGFRTDKAKDFSLMFNGCESLVSLDLSGFDTTSGYDFSWMFCGCKSLESLDVRSFDIDRASWYSKYFDENCDAVYFRIPPHIHDMFSGCESLTDLDLKNFDTERVISFCDLFANCRNLRNLQVGQRFIITSEAKTDRMFAGCGRLDKAQLPPRLQAFL